MKNDKNKRVFKKSETLKINKIPLGNKSNFTINHGRKESSENGVYPLKNKLNSDSSGTTMTNKFLFQSQRTFTMDNNNQNNYNTLILNNNQNIRNINSAHNSFQRNNRHNSNSVKLLKPLVNVKNLISINNNPIEEEVNSLRDKSLKINNKYIETSKIQTKSNRTESKFKTIRRVKFADNLVEFIDIPRNPDVIISNKNLNNSNSQKLVKYRSKATKLEKKVVCSCILF